MSTRLDIAKRLYRGKTVVAPSSRGAAVAGGVVGTPTGDTQIRYGYATADSAGGWVTVKLDTASTEISCVCDSPIKSGQRVAVFSTSSGQLKAQVKGQNIVDDADEKYATKMELENKGDELELTITQIGDKADDAADKADGAAGDAEEALNAANEVKAYFNVSVDGLEVGQEGNPVSVLMASDGSFKVLYNGKVVSVFGDTYSKIGTSLAGTGTSYATLDIYGGTLTYNIQPPSTDIGQGGYFQFLAPTVEMRSDLDSTTYVRVAANGLVYIGSNKRSGVLSDWVTNHSDSGSWTVREHASGFTELMEIIDMDFPVGGSTQLVSLPVTFGSWQDYQVHLQLLGDTTNYASHFNNISLMAHSFSANSFVIGAWNSANVAVNGRYRVAVHVTGMSS